MQTMLDAYIECALWSTNDNADETGGEPLDSNYDEGDLSQEAYKQMAADCDAFYEAALTVAEKLDASLPDTARMGHDFWLTRNEHGAGFWDRGLGKLGDELTKLARDFGPADLYVADEQIHHS